MVFTATALLGENSWGSGDGSSKKAAEAAAAEVAVKAIRTIYPDYRR
jgi:ribonuclease-3